MTERNELYLEVGQRVRATRELFGATQDDVARALECDVTTVARYERGERIPTGEHLIKISLAAYTSPDWILLGFIDQLPKLIREAITQAVPDLVRTRARPFHTAGGDGPETVDGTPETEPGPHAHSRPRRRPRKPG